MPKYEIVDEPSPGSLAGAIVNPFWPLLGLMLGGAWLSWPWFLLNGHALGSATQKREHKLLGAALGGSVVLALIVAAMVPSTHEAHAWRYTMLGLSAFKLTLGYLLYTEQRKSFQIHETFGGKGRNAAMVLLGAYLVRQALFSAIDNLFLLLILA